MFLDDFEAGLVLQLHIFRASNTTLVLNSLLLDKKFLYKTTKLVNQGPYCTKIGKPRRAMETFVTEENASNVAHLLERMMN